MFSDLARRIGALRLRCVSWQVELRLRPAASKGAKGEHNSRRSGWRPGSRGANGTNGRAAEAGPAGSCAACGGMPRTPEFPGRRELRAPRRRSCQRQRPRDRFAASKPWRRASPALRIDWVMQGSAPASQRRTETWSVLVDRTSCHGRRGCRLIGENCGYARHQP